MLDVLLKKLFEGCLHRNTQPPVAFSTTNAPVGATPLGWSVVVLAARLHPWQ